MMSRRASYLGLVGIVAASWMLAFGCSLDTTGFGDSEEACTADAHCDDGNVCTVDQCGADGTCTHTDVADGQYPDGVTGNCKVYECAGGEQDLVPFADDVDDGDDCTVDKCTDSGASHQIQAGAACRSGGGLGVCQADGSCSIECGGVDDNGVEIGCPASEDACSISYCDKSIGKCVLDALDGIPLPGTTPGDCGGTYCVNGKSSEQLAAKGATCAGTTAAGNPAIVCDGAGSCVGCNEAQDCNPDGTPESFCFHALCVNTECDVTEEADGTVLPAGQQNPGDCKQKQCMSDMVISVPLDGDIEDDMNACTADSCSGGNPVHAPTPLDSPCGVDGSLFCNGSGNCQGCTMPSQCGTNTDCHQFACNGGACADIFAPVDTPVSAAQQTAGDCALLVCNGSGGVKSNPADTDVPNDSNDCTGDQCSGGSPVFPPVGVGSVCSQNRICDATGHCLGGPCGGAGDCPSGASCADGVCCNSECTAQCEACTNTLKGTGLNGDCGISAPGTDSNDTDCPGPQVCDGTLGATACKLPVGQPCNDSTECLLGNCVDGYCCNNACSGLCRQCNGVGSQGTCTDVPGGQDPANECSGAVACNGTGACGALFVNGAACTTNLECQSGFCADNVCCSAQCGGLCQSCVLANLVGTCTSIPLEQDPGNECAGTDVCNGAGACGKAKGTSCGAAADCASGYCVDGVCCDNACSAECIVCNLAGSVGTCSNIGVNQDPANECPGATTCNGNGACGLFSNGVACSANNECGSGHCVDSVCCNDTCGSNCQACNLAGTTGTCTSIPNGQDPADECTGARVCNGSGACVGGPLGAACGGAGECGSGNCVDGVCCNNACSTTCEACNLANSVGTCSNIANGLDPTNDCPGVTTCDGSGACALLANGTVCTLGAECGSGNCVDGVCCNTACNGACEACDVANSAGTCSYIALGQDPANECLGTLSCDGGGACQGDVAAICSTNAQCGNGQCVDNVCCQAASCSICQTCNGSSPGICTDLPLNDTDNFPVGTCSGTNSCDGSGQCKKNDGQSCSGADSDCVHGHCVDGLCCDTACSGLCRACSNALSGGADGTCTFIPSGSDPETECTSPQVCNGAGACN